MAQSTTRPAAEIPDVARTRAALAVARPGLLTGFDAALPGARASVLGRLLGALDREPLPGVARRAPGEIALDHQPSARVTRHAPDEIALNGEFLPGVIDGGTPPAGMAGGRGLTFPAAAAAMFAEPSPGLAVHLGTAAIDDPGLLVRALWPGSPLAAEIDNSVANLALARAARAGGDDVRTGEPDGPGRAEQLVDDGHPLHPCCRTRAGMSTADVLAYAPEHRPVIRLRRLRVPADRWHGDGPPVLYAHPWQAERLRDAYPWLADDGATGPVRPLMSLRTVAPIDGGDHVKTAVDVRMTSAVRTVSPAAVHNGPRLSALLTALTRDLPLGVLAETAAGAVIVDGEPRRGLAHLLRRAPRLGPDEVVVPLGALPAVLATAGRDGAGTLGGTGTLGGDLLLAMTADPHGWFGELAPVLWTPLVTVLHRGVALEAHGQNTLLVLRAGRPVRILYRDLGGVRVSPRRLRAAGADDPGLIGDLPTDDPRELRTKLAAAALGTVAGQLIALLAGGFGADPARLWATVAAAVRAAGTPDTGPLLGDPLPVKATTAMRLAADPLDDIWTTVDNPMAGEARR